DQRMRQPTVFERRRLVDQVVAIALAGKGRPVPAPFQVAEPGEQDEQRADRDGELRQRLLDEGIGVLYKPVKPLALRQMLQRVAAAAERA
ncbi:MAG: hypothetical protein KGJ96_12325, partial [Xanthomonadaceae bacterium]|nr:hypothetical protein [Xanthomonadaceae bacterium]MDE2249348.1 hypothetical protein [Xanthomonadaceae bacterium]